MQPALIQAFLTKWQASGAAERANAHLFIAELCDVLGVEHPQPKKPEEAANAYVFEKTIPSITDSSNFIDCYKRGCFVLESKQGIDKDNSAPLSADGEARKKNLKTGHGVRGTGGWDTAMLKAREQAQRYARALPKEEIQEGRPPFILVVDVGHSIALYTDWSRMGGEYIPYPDPATYRIALKDLVREEVRDLLRAVWTDPLSLDPGRRSAKVTREIADRLAKLARSLEKDSGSKAGMTPEKVANFLMRCLFTMFSEDVDLLPHGSFTKLLGELKSEPGNFQEMLENLWGTMNTGGLSPILRKKLPRFNGGLFAHADAIALNADQIQLLIEASTANWKDVEPAIFGTLLERALDPRERHKLGAHYTPRAYVERLVNPTVIEPLRAQWASVQVAALQLAEEGEDKKAIKQIETFLHQLATVKVLDPACGSGNFLYVTLELLKRLEGEVLNTLHDLGATSKLELEGVMVTPANFFGIELNPRAAAIAEQVLWIGFLQWHLRTHGNPGSGAGTGPHNWPEPIIKDLHNIQNRDAVLEYDERLPVMVEPDVSLRAQSRSEKPVPLTRWDGHTTKPHAVTGEAVPDPEARVPVYTYSNPKPAKWPAADYIVGNPPFIGNKRMRDALGDGYAESLREVHSNLPESCDFVMYWWEHAGRLVAEKKAKRFGFITTNSITQTFNRKIVSELLEAKKPISLAFAIPDHPWVDSADGAAVRVAMTVGISGRHQGELLLVERESPSQNDEAEEVALARKQGYVHADLSTGAAMVSAQSLLANSDLVYQGVKLVGEGFLVTEEERREWIKDYPTCRKFLPQLVAGTDVNKVRAPRYCIDFFGLTEAEAKEQFAAAYQKLLITVKPFREMSKRDVFIKYWWLFGWSRTEMRGALYQLKRYIATSEVSKHRFFMFLSTTETIADGSLAVVAIEDAFTLGVLSSNIHVSWALAQGGALEDRPRWQNASCFENFPFPTCTPAQQAKIRALGEQLDAHRRRQQALHPELTMTGMYNVLDRLRAIEPRDAARSRVEPGTTAPAPLTAKEKVIYEQGLVDILKQLHDELDAAVAEAYGWPDPGSSPGLSTDEILTKLVALNAERAAEEAKGQVRWLRPEYQNRGAAKATQAKMDVEEEAAPVLPAALRAWPNELPAQAASLTEVLASLNAPASVEDIAACFEGKRTKKRLDEMTKLLETLKAVGRAGKRKDSWLAG